MGTETNFNFCIRYNKRYYVVKKNNPLMGTETVCPVECFVVNTINVKKNNPLMGTETKTRHIVTYLTNRFVKLKKIIP